VHLNTLLFIKVLETYRTIRYLSLLLILLGMSPAISAQLDTSGLWVNIDSIQISATRISKAWLRSSKSVSELNLHSKEMQPQLSLKEQLQGIPGVFAMNTMNSAQDLRISVRGFGARSAFGVRGVKLIVDGVPETTPDGQGQMDGIPLSLLRKIELIRGPASTQYGNASGGVIQMSTLSSKNYNLLAGPFAEARMMVGSFRTAQLQATYAQNFGSTTSVGHLAYLTSKGYRNHSHNSQLTGLAKVEHDFSKFSKINFTAALVASPLAEDPGGLNFDQSASRPTAARAANLDFDSRESVYQYKLSSAYSFQVDAHKTFNAYGFYLNRKYDGYLPFLRSSIVDLDRKFFGQGASYTVVKNAGDYKQTLKYGYDVSTQLDDRLRSDVDTLGGQNLVTTDQRESYKNVGAYVMLELNLGDLLVNGGLRFDHNSIMLDDRYSFDGNGSGTKDFSVFNPSLGLNYLLPGGAAIFANYSTGFDTPVLSELSNNPNGPFGLNFSLEPQESLNLELGAKIKFDDRIKAQVVIFRINTDDELIPFEIDTLPGRNFYRNVGKTKRSGLEAEIQVRLPQNLTAKFSYTYSNFKLDDYVREGIDLSGKEFPGIPPHRVFLNLKYFHNSGFNVILDNQYVGSLYTNDQNTVSDPGYFLSDLRLSYALIVEDYKIQPFLGINNLLNTSYNDNIRINAFGGRYFEPGPKINFFGGVSVRF